MIKTLYRLTLPNNKVYYAHKKKDIVEYANKQNQKWCLKTETLNYLIYKYKGVKKTKYGFKIERLYVDKFYEKYISNYLNFVRYKMKYRNYSDEYLSKLTYIYLSSISNIVLDGYNDGKPQHEIDELVRTHYPIGNHF